MRLLTVVATIVCLSPVGLGAERPFALMYHPGDRYRLTLSTLAVHDLKEPPAGKPSRLVRTWDATANLTFKEKGEALALTLDGLELTGTWDGGPLPKDLFHILDRAIGKLELILPREADGTVRLPPDVEKSNERVTAIAECLLPVLPDEPVAPGGVWSVSLPKVEGPHSWLVARAADQGLYAGGKDYRRIILLDGGWRPRNREDSVLSKLTYTDTDLHRYRVLVVYYARAQRVVVRSALHIWRRPEHQAPSPLDQQIVESYTLTRLRSPSDDR